MTEKILSGVCTICQINRMEIDNKSRRRDTQPIVEARQISAHMLWRYTDLTLEQIADILGYRRKQNVYDAKKKVREIASANGEFKVKLAMIEAKFLRD